MGKDPAFLFYPGDWISGTMGMTFEEKGAYMELLMAQFHQGHMTSHMVGRMVGQHWDTIKHKFTQDGKGLWFNRRLDEEKMKRKSFTDSRKNNLTGENQYSKKKKKRGHTTSHMEDGNVNEDKSEKGNKKEIIYPFDSIAFLERWAMWKQYKKDQHNFTYKGIVSEQAALKRLSELSQANEQTALKIIEQSISNGWQGFFILKPNGTGTTKNNGASTDFDALAESIKRNITH